MYVPWIHSSPHTALKGGENTQRLTSERGTLSVPFHIPTEITENYFLSEALSRTPLGVK